MSLIKRALHIVVKCRERFGLTPLIWSHDESSQFKRIRFLLRRVVVSEHLKSAASARTFTSGVASDPELGTD
jgi:hypothetical protein